MGARRERRACSTACRIERCGDNLPRLIRSLPTRRGVLGVAPATRPAGDDDGAGVDVRSSLRPGARRVTLRAEQGEDTAVIQSLGAR